MESQSLVDSDQSFRVHYHTTPTHSIPESTESEASDISLTARRLVFVLIILLHVVLNFDSGAISASLVRRCNPDHELCKTKSEEDGLIAVFSLSYTEAGLLGPLVYLGLTVAGFSTGTFLSKFSPRVVIGWSTLGSILSILAFAYAPSKNLVLASRLMSGVMLSPVLVYTPVWIDEFAPLSSCTTWISVVHAGAPLGIVLGYAVAGLMAANMETSWRAPFFIQVLLWTPLLLLWVATPTRYIDAANLSPASPLAPTFSAKGFLVSPVKRMFENDLDVCCRPLFIYSSLALSCLYFVVTAVQVWATPYLRGPPFNVPANMVTLYFSVICATAPVAGVVVGGYIVDRVGGYKYHVNCTARVVVCFGILATIAGWVVVLSSNLAVALTSMWMVLFGGGAIVPSATGMMLSSVSPDERSTASAISMIITNLFGYFAGPFLSGLVANMVGHLEWAFRLTMLWSNVALITVLLAWHAAERLQKRRDALVLQCRTRAASKQVAMIT